MKLRSLALIACMIFAASCSSEEDVKESSGEIPESLRGCRFVESGQGPAGTVRLRAEKLITGLEVPWAIGFLPGGDVLVSERVGRVRRLSGGRLIAAPVVNLSVGEPGEGGLMGLAVDPAFASNRRFYIYYTATDAAGESNRLERYRLSDDSSAASLERVLVEGISSGPLHNGGRLRFGPDGFLYLSTGDARNPVLAQNPSSLNGKLLRVSPETGEHRIFLSGIRNTQGFDWWNESTLVLSDHGPTGDLGLSGLDEVSFARDGENLGWPVIHGCGTDTAMRTPFIAWKEALPPGGTIVYRGSAIPSFTGSVLVTALGSRHLHRITPSGANEAYLSGDAGFGRLREVQQAPDGSLWITTSNCDGRGTCGAEKDLILRITEEG